MRGYVYILKEDSFGYIKIGKSRDLSSRIELFEVKLPFKVNLVCSFLSDRMGELELLFHEVFAPKRTNGEWFNITDQDVENIKLEDFGSLLQNQDHLSSDDVVYYKRRFKELIRHRKIRSDVKTRVNSALDQTTHDLLVDAAYRLKISKTSLASMLIQDCLSNPDFLEEFFKRYSSRKDWY